MRATFDRIRFDQGIDRGQPFEIVLDGVPVTAYPGETVAAVALAARRYALRFSARGHAPRGVFCGMGICQECRMVVNGEPNVRTCLTLATPGCRVAIQDGFGAPLTR